MAVLSAEMLCWDWKMADALWCDVAPWMRPYEEEWFLPVLYVHIVRMTLGRGTTSRWVRMVEVDGSFARTARASEVREKLRQCYRELVFARGWLPDPGFNR